MLQNYIVTNTVTKTCHKCCCLTKCSQIGNYILFQTTLQLTVSLVIVVFQLSWSDPSSLGHYLRIVVQKRSRLYRCIIIVFIKISIFDVPVSIHKSASIRLPKWEIKRVNCQLLSLKVSTLESICLSSVSCITYVQQKTNYILCDSDQLCIYGAPYEHVCACVQVGTY